LQLDNLEKDRQLAQLSHKLERISEDLEKKRQEIDQSKGVSEGEKKQLLEKIEASKKKLQDVQNEYMQKTMDYGR